MKLFFNGADGIIFHIAPRTCHDLKMLNVTMSGNYFIDPDGPFAGDYPISVYCDLNSGKNFTKFYMIFVRILFIIFCFFHIL